MPQSTNKCRNFEDKKFETLESSTLQNQFCPHVFKLFTNYMMSNIV